MAFAPAALGLIFKDLELVLARTGGAWTGGVGLLKLTLLKLLSLLGSA